MIRRSIMPAFILSLVMSWSTAAAAVDPGLFRTVPVDTPQKGTLWVSNTSFYAPLTVNSVLRDTYNLTDTKIFSSVTQAAVGITNSLALTGGIPFYADMFKQAERSGEKTGPGDVNLGLRMAFRPQESVMRSVSVGMSASIPVEMGYGAEPLGFRTFSTSEFSYAAELSFGMRLRMIDGYLSTVFRRYPGAETPAAAYLGDVFYESANGYLGIGRPDAEGRADVIFQDHLTITTGAAVPIRSWLSGIVEFSATRFIAKPDRDTIMRLAPGVRIGSPDRPHLAAGVDFRLSGPVPVRTWLFQVTVPFLSPKSLKIPEIAEPMPKDIVRSRNSLVAVRDFSRRDLTFLYENELRRSFTGELASMGIMKVMRNTDVDDAISRMELVPREDSPERLGVRLGANYLINTTISKYVIERKSSFSIPYVVGFPKTVFSLSAAASVTDLVTGETHDLGVISARVDSPRGVNMFPSGASSDITHLSEPERRQREKELIDRWVERFNDVIYHNMQMFGWEPKRTEIRGDEETSG